MVTMNSSVRFSFYYYYFFTRKKVIAICAAEIFQELKGLSQDAARIAVRRYFIIRRC